MTAEAPLKPSEPIQRLPLEVKPLRWGLFVLTLLSAAAALFAEPLLASAVDAGAIDPRWMFAPLACFGLFLAVYAVDRWFLVRKRSYPPGRAFFQIAFGVMFALLLLPSAFDDWRRPQAEASPDAELRLLAHPDPEVRVVAVEALGFRGVSPSRVRAIAARLDDRDPRVRASARRVLSTWSSIPEGDRASLSSWARRWSEGAR